VCWANAIRTGLMVGSLLAGSGIVWAQEPANPAVDAIFADLSKPNSPGCAIGIFRDGKIIYQKGYGLANLEQNVPITPQTVFDVGSISKQFTAISILFLEKQGKLRLDDDVRKYIPELPDYSKDGQKMTLLQLLNHTSGLRDYVSLFLLAGVHYDNVTTDEDALQFIVRQKGLNFSPGADWKYTGSGYLLLALVVQRVTGKKLKDFAEENIFQPLGMKQTQYRNDHTSLIPNRALAYEQDESGVYKLSVSYAEQNGDGMIHTSVEDLQKWDENFYSGQIGGKELLAEMQERGKLADGRPVKYTKGLFLQNYRGLSTVWHAGESAGYLSNFLRFPEQHFSVACLCNGRSSPIYRSYRVAQVYLDELMKQVDFDFATAEPEAKPSVALSRKQLLAWTGNYRNPKDQEIWQVTEKEGTLWLDFEGYHRRLRALSPTEFAPLRHIHEIRLKFEPSQNAAPRKVIVSREMESPATFEAVKAPALSPTELAAYAGDYWSEELRATYRLAMRDNKLWMKDLIGADGIAHRGTIPSGELRPVSADEFVVEGPPLAFHFTRDDNSKIAGFVLSGFSERGILFTLVNQAK